MNLFLIFLSGVGGEKGGGGEEGIPNLPPENDKTKGSSMKAVFGIIFLESGLDAVETAF